MPLDIVVTNAGRAALVNAENTGTDPVTITEVGLSSTAVTALPTLTALVGEFKRVGAVSGEVVAEDTIHLSVMDSSPDSYTLRSIALYLADGTLFAIYGQPGPVLEKTASSDAALSIDVIFSDISAALLTFGDASFVNPPASTERQGVMELATVPEAQAGVDALRALTPATARAAVLGWLLTQDGAGSGVDADLLDGKDGSWYADIVARLGFAPVNKTGDTMTGLLSLSGNPTANGHAANKQYVDGLVAASALLAKLLNVDGAGSGLDADLLDGRDSSWFTDIIARLGYAPINKGGDVVSQLISYVTSGALGITQRGVSAGQALEVRGAAGNGAAIMAFHRPGNFAAYFGLDNDNRWKVGGWSMGAVAYDLWHSGNDGAGSGLDADALDGHDGAAYARIIGADATREFGYRMFADGFKMCWGTNSFAGDQTKAIFYPFTFAAWSHAFVEGGVNSVGQQENGPFVVSSSTTGFTGMNAANASVPVSWFAFGY